MKPIKLAIVDDHLIFLEGMKLLFKEHARIDLVEVFSSGQLFLNYIKNNEIDVVLMDISMPKMNGIECVQKMKETNNDIAVIGLSMHNEKQYIHAIKKAEFNGYLLKNVDLKTLDFAISEVYYGREYYHEEIKNHLKVNELAQSINFDKITKREKEIIKLLCNSKTSSEIADKLFVAEGTIKTHRKNILRKFNIHSTPELIQFVNENKMLIFT